MKENFRYYIRFSSKPFHIRAQQSIHKENISKTRMGRVPVSIDYFCEKIQTLFQFSWVVAFYVKIFNCCPLKTFKTAHAKLVRNGHYQFDKRVLSYSNIHITFEYFHPPLLKLIFRKNPGGTISADFYHEKQFPTSKRTCTGFY